MTIKFIGRTFAAMVALAGLATSAQATPVTWTDTYNNVQTLNLGQSITYTHDLTLSGFRPGQDTINDIKLTINLRDDQASDSNEWALVTVGLGLGLDLGLNLPLIDLVPGYQNYAFEYDNSDWSFLGRWGLNETGLLDVTLTSVKKCTLLVFNCSGGDFIFGGSQLVANGERATPVPEPSVLALFGLGLLGVAVGARPRNAKSA